MANITVTYSFSNSTTIDASQVNTNFTDIINGTSDGTKDFSISALTCAGAATLNGNVTLGNASTDDVTITGSLASTIPIKTTATYAIGSSTLGLLRTYYGRNTQSVSVEGSASMSATYTFTLPVTAGSAGNWMHNSGSGVMEFTNTTTTGKTIDGTADEVQLTVQGHSTQTSTIFLAEKSDGTDLLAVTNTDGTKLKGTTLGTARASGIVGEALTWQKDTNTAITTGQYNDLASGTITAGLWLATASVRFIKNGGTYSTADFRLGFNVTSGNSGTGLAETYNMAFLIQNSTDTGFDDFTISLPPTLVRYDGTTITLENGATMTPTTNIVYLKSFISGITAGSPVTRGRMLWTRIA